MRQAERLPCFLHVDVLVFGPRFHEGTLQSGERSGIAYDFTELLVSVVLGMLLCVKETLDFLFV